MSDFPSSSIEGLERDLAENAFNIRALSELAQHYANDGDYSSAASHYERIVRADEDNTKAWTALGHCFLLKGDYSKCYSAYNKALQITSDSKDPQLWYGVGILSFKFNKTDQAERAYQMVLALDPEFEHEHEILYKIGLIRKKKLDYDGACEYLRKCSKCENLPSDRKIDALCHLGGCLEQLKAFDQAIVVYKEALAIEEGNFKTREYLGWAYCLLKDYEEARKQFTQALDCIEDNSAETADLYFLIGLCYSFEQNYAQAQIEIQRAIYKNPNAYIFWCTIGIIYAKASQAQDAFDCFIKASNINPLCGIVWLNMGVLYELCEQREEASLSYGRAFKLNENLVEAQRRNSELQAKSQSGTRPEFMFPPFAISEVPFSIKITEIKEEFVLPDIQTPSNVSQYEPKSVVPQQTFITSREKQDPTSIQEEGHTQNLVPQPEVGMMNPYQIMMNPMMYSWMFAMHPMMQMQRFFFEKQTKQEDELSIKRSAQEATPSVKKKRK